MQLSKTITTREDISKWTSFLEGLTKEELIDILLMKMIKDSMFSASLQIRYGAYDLSVEETLDEYRKRTDEELYEKYPDVQYLEHFQKQL